MRCPYCGHTETRVVDSRDRDGSVRRRRECEGCSNRFWTYERIEFPPLMVVKKDGRRELFRRDKLLAGIRKACEKRPLGTEVIERVVDSIEAKLQALGQAEVPSRRIGEFVMDSLMDLDEIAYIRFAIVYRSLADMPSVQAEMQRLVESRGQAKSSINQLPLPFDGLGEEAPSEPRPRSRRR